MRYHITILSIFLVLWCQLFWYKGDITTFSNWVLSSLGLAIAYIGVELEHFLKVLKDNVRDDPEWTEDDVV